METVTSSSSEEQNKEIVTEVRAGVLQMESSGRAMVLGTGRGPLTGAVT